MASRARAIVGGALEGLGQGLAQRAQNKRDDTERLRQEAVERARQMRQDLMYQEQQRLQRENSNNQVAQTVADADGNLRAITRGSDVRDLDFKVPPPRSTSSGADESGFSAGDQRLWNTVTERYTQDGGLSGVDNIDWAAVSREFTRMNRPDLARLAGPADAQPTIDTQSSEWSKAEEMAEQWIKEKTTVLGRDSTQLAEYGGSRTQARLAKTREFYDQLTGRSDMGTDESGQPSAPAASAPTSGPLPGAGTQERPYRPTTQEEFEKIASGAIYLNPADGKLYRKN